MNDVVFAGLVELVGDMFIVAGDCNTARVQRSKHGRKAGEEFFDRTRKEGWYDCVWDKLGDEVQTWFREGNHLRQNDHAFCNQSLGDQLQRVRVATDAAIDLRLSDHAALILDFDVAPISMMGLTDQPD